MPPSCALLGGFAIGARVALLWQHTRTLNVSEYMLVLDVCLVLLYWLFGLVSAVNVFNYRYHGSFHHTFADASIPNPAILYR